ncbi:DUF3488 and transglutaminase-like domain-containing protein [Microbacterium marmarense]|uniref:DUF3488 and transglutaminase-like domain-containing protein n=1 Tax=Microbacterium marmarense TaxID=3122051 RepID=A0ABU8LS24_9MICO
MSWRNAAASSVTPEVAEMRVSRRGARTLTIAVYAALTAALLPVLNVVEPSGWLFGALALAAVILMAGYFARRARLPAIAVSLIEIVLWALFMTGAFFGSTALFWVVPTPATIDALPTVLAAAQDEIIQGAAPLEPSIAVSVLIVGAMGLLAIIIDHVVITARMPLLASVGLIAVSLIPAIVVSDEADVMSFIYLAAAILFLLRAETRSREKPAEQQAERTAGVPATAMGIAAIAVVVAVAASPLLPEPTVRVGSQFGAGPGIDASLSLGDDLRQPDPIEVIRYQSNASSPPYLRATTLSQFDGAVWEPDPLRTVPLESSSGLVELNVDEDVLITPAETSVSVVNLASYWLPIPWAATAVSGLEGSWSAVPANRTVVSQSATTQGQQYEVSSLAARPTREQIRSMDAAPSPRIDDATVALPDDLPPIIGELAAEVTEGTTNDYDALIALQRWFRGGEFRYSLEAPVEDGFDGSGADAVAEFLEVREGYCVHFAAAFTMMARTLDMPTRIVVGYLPGNVTGEVEDGEPVYSVMSDTLHSWPEVYFEGVGWVGFEPTAGLGTPTAFAPESFTPGAADNSLTAQPEERPTATSTPGADLQDLNVPLDGASGVIRDAETNFYPVLGAVVFILAALTAPAIIRAARQRSLIRSANDGDALAAWAIVQNAAIDLGISVPGAETPRAFANRLVSDHEASSDAMQTLVYAIEHASYSGTIGRNYGLTDAAAAAAVEASASLFAHVAASRRVLAVVVPRSLLVRPGSVYAGATGLRQE